MTVNAYKTLIGNSSKLSSLHPLTNSPYTVLLRTVQTDWHFICTPIKYLVQNNVSLEETVHELLYVRDTPPGEKKIKIPKKKLWNFSIQINIPKLADECVF